MVADFDSDSTSSTVVRIRLHCEDGSPGQVVHMVENGGSRVTPAEGIVCRCDEDRVQLARDLGFPTTAERDHARAVGVDRTSDAIWTVSFDMAAYAEALDRAAGRYGDR